VAIVKRTFIVAYSWLLAGGTHQSRVLAGNFGCSRRSNLMELCL
jgi:hypothetical protein